MYWTQGLEFAAAPSLSVAQSGLVPGEIITGLDIAYNFSPSDMAGKSTPNLAPADAAQQWAIPNAGPFLSTFNDSYGSYWFSITNASGSGGLPSGNFSSSQYITTTYKQPLTAFTVSDCFGHYPSALLNNPSSGAIALQWGGNLTISWVSTSNGNTTWDVNVLGTDIGHVNIPDNSLGCIVVRRNSQNLVQVYTSAGIGASLPLTVAQSATVTGTFSTSSALEFGDASNSFWGIQSSARVWHLDVPDDGLVQQFAALRPAMWNRGPGAAIAMGPSGSSSSLAVSVAGVTNTQAVLSYTASDSSPCTVTVSENSSLSPPVNDVNSSLFSGSNLDNRTGSIANGLARKFVTGLRAVQQGTDGNWYSRSLQAYTTHYLQVACDTAIGTGSFTTANIPTNVGYRDPQPVNPSTGQKILPTLTASRSQIIKDPFTGAKVARVTLPADFVGGHNGSGDAGGGNLGDGAYPLCGPSTGPGPGYICTLMSGDGGYAQMYYIVPSTGAVTYLGIPRIAAEGGLGFSWATYTDPIYGYLYVQGVSGFYQAWYSGDYSAASPGAYATMSYNTLFTGTTFAAMVHAFNPAFDPTYFTCGNSRANGDYITVGCGRNGQDSYGWGAVYSVSSNAIVAAGAPHLNSTTSWCALHNQDGIYNLAMQELSLHGFSGNGTVLGQGPYTTTLSGDINASVTSIGISGEPECSGCGSDPALPVAAVGDWFTFPSGEIVRIVTKTSSTAWVVTRGANGTTAAPQSSGAVMTATCAPSTPWLSFWQFTEDPDMADTTNAYYTYDDAYWTQTGGHASFGATFEAGEGYNGYIVRPGSGTASPITQVNQPIANVGAQSTFAGAFNYCFGETCKEYPYVGPTGTTWLTDDHSFAGTGDGSWTNKAGNLYVFTPNVNYSYYLYTPKYQSIETVTGQAWAIGTTYYYTNISGPGSAIGTTTAYNQQVCQAYLAGECYAGSTPGQIYFNTSQALTAGGECGSGVDFCALNYGWWANALIQIGQNNVGRVLTYGLNTFREPMDYTISSTLPDGSWTLFVTGDNKSIARGDAPSHVLMVKQTPFTPPDAVDRTKFVPVTMSLTAHGTGAVAAAVKFGYAEYGAPSAYHCSQYADICVANTNAAPPADGTTAPFQYATSDTWTGISCASTCSITIPVLPGHLAYAQAEYLNSSGAVVATDAPVLIGDNM
jgi:hypothetical protein